MEEVESEGTLSSIIASLNKKGAQFQTRWFRGQSNYDHKLIPSIFRQGKDFKVAYNEQKMFDEFKRRYPDHSVSHRTTYEWLTLMQHYELPTRLLDWSSNLLVALYFCCKDDSDNDGSLFMLDPTRLEQAEYYKYKEFLEMQVQVKSQIDFFERIIYGFDHILNGKSRLNGVPIEEIRKDYRQRSQFLLHNNTSFNSLEHFEQQPLKGYKKCHGDYVPDCFANIKKNFSNIVAFEAPYLNPRIKQQQGCFTLHGGMFIDGKEFIPVVGMESEMYKDVPLIRLKIQTGHKKEILEELSYTGIKEATLFPEMEYQALEIKELYSSTPLD